MKRWLYILTLATVLAVSGVSFIAHANATPRIEQVANDEPTVTGNKGTIVLVAADSDATFSIYSVTGQLLRTVKVNAGTKITVEIPKGFYIVKCTGHWSRKVVVK